MNTAKGHEPVLSVVIPTLGREESLVRTIEGLLADEYGQREIIIIDQTEAHTPETTYFFQRIEGLVTHIRVDYNSLPRARNDGLRKAKGKIVLFVDDDVIIPKGFCRAHAENYLADDVSGVTGPILKPLENFARELHKGWETAFNVDFVYFPPWSPGCNMSYRRDVLLELNGFDENFVGSAIGEDADFGKRMIRAGYRIMYDPAASLIHLNVPGGGCRTVTDSFESTRNLASNWIYFHLRYNGVAKVLARLPLFFVRTITSRVRRSISGLLHLPAIISGFLAGLLLGMQKLWRGFDSTITSGKRDVYYGK
jgi:GT2 family glycosyltransferase